MKSPRVPRKRRLILKAFESTEQILTTHEIFQITGRHEYKDRRVFNAYISQIHRDGHLIRSGEGWRVSPAALADAQIEDPQKPMGVVDRWLYGKLGAV